jgi:hypothetical protein
MLESESRGTRDHIYCPRFKSSFSSPPMTRRATVEEFNTAFTRECNQTESETEYYTTDGQSASLSWVAVLLTWGLSLSLTRGRSIVYNCCWPRQRSHSGIRIPWHSQPYFTLSHSKLPFSSPPTTRSYDGGIRPPTEINKS